MKFLHTSDWQMGMKAESIGLQGERVREARIEAARRVIQAAREHEAEMILLTGDVFENNAVDRLLVRKVGEILRGYAGPVYIIPGNHDPLTPGSVWEHSVWSEASNITVFRTAQPLELEQCILFPCPLHEKYSTKNPTAWIDAHSASKPAIALAHGNVQGISGAEPDYPIPRDASARLGLDYLALGHWHSFAKYDDSSGSCRMAYAGTHETTKFGERESGHCVLVEIRGRGQAPTLTPIKTGQLTWRTLEKSLGAGISMEGVVQEVEAIANPEQALVRVQLGGILHPKDREPLAKLGEILASRFLFGALDTRAVIPAPDSDDWLQSLPAGAFQETAARLRSMAGHPSDPGERVTATQALLQLFALQEKARA